MVLGWVFRVWSCLNRVNWYKLLVVSEMDECIWFRQMVLRGETHSKTA